jgi:hypothetical protein
VVFFHFFLFIDNVLNKLLKKPIKNNYTFFFLKNVNLKKKIYNPEENNYTFDYRTEQQIKDARATRPFLFKDAYKLYSFFESKNSAKESFSALNLFFGIKNNFLSFFFIYIFVYYRLFRINFFYSKNSSKMYRNRYFYELIFLIFYFFKEIKFKNNSYYLNKYYFFLKKLDELKLTVKPITAIPETILPQYEKIVKTTTAYKIFLKKYVKVKTNNFLSSSAIIFANSVYKNNFMLKTNKTLKKN